MQRMLGHASAAMTLDVHADLFEDDLAVVAERLDSGLAQTVVGKIWVERAIAHKEPLDMSGIPGVQVAE